MVPFFNLIRKIMRVFEELTPECDKTAQLFAVGLEQKEIAEVKFRA